MSSLRTVAHPRQALWMARWGAALAWGLAAVVIVHWVLKFQPGAPGSPLAPGEATMTRPAQLGVDAARVARALGHADAAPLAVATAPVQAPGRLVLVGVVAEPGASRGGIGAALIAIDGKPARPFRVGREVEPGLVLQAVEARRVHLGRERGGASTLTLELPSQRR